MARKSGFRQPIGVHLGLFLPLMFTSVLVTGQVKLEDLEKQYDHYRDHNLFNGTVLIAKHGEVVFKRSIGYAPFEEGIVLTDETAMPISSITKPFTALAIMILQERGLLQVDDPVSKYLADFPYADISIRHLLNHTAGFKRSYKEDLYTTEDILTFVYQKRPRLSFSPGTQFLYSNLGYSLLAAIVEAVSNQPFDKFLEDEIFKKTDMSNTFLLTTDNTDRTKANSYNEKNKIKEWHLASYPGAKGIYASASDLLRWDQILYTDELVSSSLISACYQSGQLKDGTSMNYGFGWRKWKGEENLVFHAGDWLGNESILFRDIEKRWTVIILANRQNAVNKWVLMEEILKVIYP